MRLRHCFLRIEGWRRHPGRFHLTAFGAVRGGHLVEIVILRNLVLFKSAAGEPFRCVQQI
jgi:hypothetical protein